MLRLSFCVLIIFITLSFNQKAFSTEDEKWKKATPISQEDLDLYGHRDAIDGFGFQGPLTATEIYERTIYILTHYNNANHDLEPSYQDELSAFSQVQTLEGLNKILPYFDETKQFDRFSGFSNSGPGVVKTYMDRDARQNEDFILPLSSVQQNQNVIASHFKPTASMPLAGLRIALDPGHMGGSIWDGRTGKFVTDHKGHIISEGVINLQTCLLLKERFEEEGAVVIVTHETMGPVTHVPWDKMDYSKYIPDQIFESTLDSWFLTLIQQAPPGPALVNLFNRNSHVKKFYSPKEMQWEDFVLREDLDARTKIIETFKPDITLVIHYDTSDPANDPNGVGKTKVDYTKAYVAGGFDPTDFASRAFRRDLAKHIFNPYWWNASVSLASSVIAQLETHLALKPDRGLDGDAIEIHPGLQSRNLNLTREIADSALAYVECLYYNDPTEFQAFSKPDFTMTIGGVRTNYSNRLVKVVDSIEAGVINFTKNLNQL